MNYKKLIPFTPRFNKSFSAKKYSEFAMIGYFVFNVRNAIYIKFKEIYLSTLMKIFAQTKKEFIKFTQSVGSATTKFIGSINTNFKLKDNTKASMIFFTGYESNNVNFITNINGILKYYIHTNPINIKINATANSVLKYILNFLNNIKFNTIANSDLLLQSNVVQRILFKEQKINSEFKLYGNLDSEFAIKDELYPNIAFDVGVKKGDEINIKTKANCIAYRLNTLGYFYEWTLDEMSNSTLDELYGEEIF